MKKEQRVAVTEWHKIVMRREVAERAHNLIKKGRLVYIEGRLKTRSFTDKEGVKRYSTEVIAHHFYPMGPEL